MIRPLANDEATASAADKQFDACRRPCPRHVVALRWGMVLSWLSFVASVLWRPHRGQYNPWLDVVVYDVPFALAAISCWLARMPPEPNGINWTGRMAWRVLSIGLVVFMCGNVYGSVVVGDRDIFPSPADAMWLTFYVLAYVAIIGLVRSRVTRFPASSWLDGAVGGLGVAALVVAWVLGPTLDVTGGKLSVVATTLAYPAAEIVLIVVLITSAVAIRARDAAFGLLGAGIAVFCVADVLYMFREAAGTYAEGGLLDVGWPLAAVLMGFAAGTSGRSSVASNEMTQQFAVPSLFAATSIGLLVAGQRHEISMVAIVLATASLLVAVVRVTLTVREVKALAMSRLEARTDQLTGLANRRRAVELLVEAVDESDHPSALLIIDLDRFKEINDSLGHGAGDVVLCHAGRRLLTAAPNSSVVARIGGDEFALILPDHTASQASVVAARLRQALVEPIDLDGMQIVMDASIGIACAPAHGTTAEAIMASADTAMYRAKRERTGVEIFTVDVDTTSPDLFELLADLRAAFGKRQFTLHYQPQMSLRTGEVVGVEALVRWHHPERGLVSPGRFLPLLEQTNQMRALTAFVLRQALADAAELRLAGQAVRMSVNVSASDLVDEGLADIIAELLDEHGLDPRMLVVEITEDTVMIDRVRSLRTLRHIRALGVHISVDDYGTGRASLSYIRDLPITELKLDRSFLEGVPADTHNAAIVRSTIELSHSLHLPLVAEGVEDERALEWLRQLGCDLGQGFHISRPLPFSQLLAWMGERAAAVPLAASIVATPRDASHDRSVAATL